MLVAVGLARRFGDFGAALRLGAVVGGHVAARGERHRFAPGFIAALSADWRAFSAPADPLTLTLALQFAVSTATLEYQDRRSGWTALDVRAALTVSRSFGVVTPYLSVRAFGGPVSWRGAGGGDLRHVQLAAGLGVEPLPGLSLHIEGAVLSERGLFGGLSYAF